MRNIKNRKIVMLSFTILLICTSVYGASAWEFDPGIDPPTPPPNSVEYYALIIGISDYQGTVPDLGFCDEDASDWYHFLHQDLYWDSDNIRIYGDSHTSNYPKYTGLATEANIRNGLSWLANNADNNDVIAILVSGHGGYDSYWGTNDRFVCMVDIDTLPASAPTSNDGRLYGYEIADYLKYDDVGKIFVFMDVCHSGGIGEDNLMTMYNYYNVYCATACNRFGNAYDNPAYQNGVFTYKFLELSWKGHYGSCSSVALESIFSYAYAHRDTDRTNDRFQQYDGSSNLFYLQ